MALRLVAFALWIGGFLGAVALIILFLPGLDYFGRLTVLSVYVVVSVALMAWSARRNDRISSENQR